MATEGKMFEVAESKNIKWVYSISIIKGALKRKLHFV